jgi:uncharacterized protein (TIGR02680 family)
MSRPAPIRERWQPLRMGLTDLFYYDHEEFAFCDGRLLLRGNNGTGKSKVLALTLPFLLDGELSPHRVEPDADRNKKMEWNLLLGGEHPHEERLGYSWLEFGRAGIDGAEFFTIGCGMKAVAHRGITAHWFFVTDQRIGDELTLVDHTNVALGYDRLDEVIDTHGEVFRSKRDYRAAVDQRLFGLGEQRYGALVDLLVKIRQPQLSKRPDERGLSAALTDALPPLDQSLLHNVAEAFRALEDDQAELDGMIAACNAVEQYLTTYREYTRVACRRRARPLRQTNSEFERVGRELTAAEEQHRVAVIELAAARDGLEALRAERARLNARQEVLRDDPAARDARDLHQAGTEVDKTRQQHLEVTGELSRASDQLATRVQRSEAAGGDLAQAAAQRDGLTTLACEHADAAALGPQLIEALGTRDVAVLPRVAADLIERQRTGVARIETLLCELGLAQHALATSRQATEQRAADLFESAERRDGAREVVAESGRAYALAARAHLQGATELALGDHASAFAELEQWLETLHGSNPLEQAISAAGHHAVRGLERAEAGTRTRAEETRGQISELERETAELEAGVHPVPEPPPTRGTDVRANRAGAPLWQLTEFRDGLDDGRRAGVEAALQASGILDAWVTPSGELVDPHTEDAMLISADLCSSGARLGGVLSATAEPANGVSPDQVERLLGAIGFGESDATVWVADDGRYRNGALRGAWHKPAAEFVGHAAREAARRARLRELAAALADARELLAGVEAELSTLAERRARLIREIDNRPPDIAVRDAHATLSAVEFELAGAESRLAAARASEETARSATERCRATLGAYATDLDLPPDAEALAAVNRAVTRLESTVASLWPAFERVTRAERTLVQTESDVREAQQECDLRAARLTEVERCLAEAIERRDTLRATAGAAIEELERQHREVNQALRGNEEAQRGAEQRLGDAHSNKGAAETREHELREQQTRSTAARLDAVHGMRRFAETGLVAVALPELATPEEWNVTQALRLARDIEQTLATDPDEDSRWARLQRRVSEELGPLADALRANGNDAAMFTSEDAIVVEVTFQGQRRTLPDLASGLGAEVGYRQQLLDSRERVILENHLVGEVASALQELISGAETTVRDTNAELANRPTSTGMRLRLRWTTDPNAPEGLADARQRLLRQSTDAWSEEDRAAVGEFLQHRIRAVRAEGASTTWIELLAHAFDYRGWHRFTVERWQANAWRSAMGPSSGGERVLAASVPLFAAASSYYSSAGNPHAPRLVMLDEAFAGVDDRARAKCLGLLAAFDLDVVMTSEREWGCYAEVPGLAIAQLSRIDGVAAVLVTRWEWNGFARSCVESPVAPTGVSPVASPDGPQLWDTSITTD